MGLESLYPGLLVALGAAAVKAGPALGRLCPAGAPRLCCVYGASACLGAVLLLIAVCFAGAAAASHPLWQNSQILHWLAAATLCVWALALRKGEAGPGASRRARLIRLISGKVCFFIIVFLTGALFFHYPDRAALFLGLVWLFLVRTVFVAAVASRYGAGPKTPPVTPPATRGLACVFGLSALYLTLAALAGPQVPELARVYRLTAHAYNERAGQSGAVFGLLAGLWLLLAIGYWTGKKPLGRTR